MNTQELKEKYNLLFDRMAKSSKTENMVLFGRVMSSMMYDLIASNPAKAEEYMEYLEAVNWKNYLTKKEAEGIIEGMVPDAPWGKEQWKLAMSQYGYPTEDAPSYNSCALWVTMNMIMSDSGQTLGKYIDSGKMFKLTYELAIDKLTDKDDVFRIRKYFGL